MQETKDKYSVDFGKIMSDKEYAPIKALLFDLGDVLIEVDTARTFALWARHSGVRAAVLKERYTFDEPYYQHERGEISAPEYFRQLRLSLRINITDDQFAEGFNAMLGQEKPAVAQLLIIAAQHMPLYLFSNTNRMHYAIWSTKYADILSHFTGIFTSPELGLRKPDPQAFTAVAARIDLPPDQILFFDDLIDNVEGARSIGMPSIHITPNYGVHLALQSCLPSIFGNAVRNVASPDVFLFYSPRLHCDSPTYVRTFGDSAPSTEAVCSGPPPREALANIWWRGTAEETLRQVKRQFPDAVLKGPLTADGKLQLPPLSGLDAILHRTLNDLATELGPHGDLSECTLNTPPIPPRGGPLPAFSKNGPIPRVTLVSLAPSQPEARSPTAPEPERPKPEQKTQPTLTIIRGRGPRPF